MRDERADLMIRVSDYLDDNPDVEASLPRDEAGTVPVIPVLPFDLAERVWNYMCTRDVQSEGYVVASYDRYTPGEPLQFLVLWASGGNRPDSEPDGGPCPVYANTNIETLMAQPGACSTVRYVAEHDKANSVHAGRNCPDFEQELVTAV